jgi:leucyl aminopeptidase
MTSASSISALLVADKGQPAVALHLTDKKNYDAWLVQQPEPVRQILTAQGFKAEGFQVAILPADRNRSWSAVLGVANIAELGPWCLARAAEVLPEGSYRLDGASPGPAMLGWLLAQYRFQKYRKDPAKTGPRILLTDVPARIDEMVSMAEAVFIARDLINTPAGDLGPAEIEAAAREFAEECGATISCVSGEALEQGYPMIAGVGRAATPDRAPRLIEMTWGDNDAPRLAVIGKGVCFDSGGLDIKPSSAMRLMKKDMGGAAHALALARLIVVNRLPVRLHLLIPTVENAVSAGGFRPGDILRSRNGMTVEVDNTDAEGRLILADAITRALEERPVMIIDYATLTGAARVALGPDLPALFVNQDGLREQIVAAGRDVGDPIWALPLWEPYGEMLSSDVADVANSSDTPMAGAVTAALFLQKFVPEGTNWVHIDTYAWRPAAKPGRPKGGDVLGVRAMWHVLKARFGKPGSPA